MSVSAKSSARLQAKSGLSWISGLVRAARPHRQARQWRRAAIWLALLSGLLVRSNPSLGQPNPVRLRITLQPDCFRPSLGAVCDRRKTIVPGGARLDMGPQIAIWIESADGMRFVDTVLVTNLTALLGIGNRPGHATLPSGPKFPYGKRLMSLPVWAHRRGKIYDSVVMQDGVEKEYWLGFHESVSSPDPYFCRPMTLQEIDVDAISCPTAKFNSSKGRTFNPATDQVLENGMTPAYVPDPKTYYPPRNDLVTFTDNDCDLGHVPGCPASAKKYASINDLDLVAAATPAYGAPFSKSWRVPDELPEGDYALFVEISKEFDNNDHHAYPSYQDAQLAEWGLRNNMGQPSVVFRVPFHLSRSAPVVAATSSIEGYGDPDGKTGTLHPADGTISDSPGSGAGRLLVITRPPAPGADPIAGRVLLATELAGGSLPDAGVEPEDAAAVADAPVDAGSETETTPEPPRCELLQDQPVELALDEVLSEGATISFNEPVGPLWDRIDEYEIHRWNGTERSEAAFQRGLPLTTMSKQTPGGRLTAKLTSLKSESPYTIGVRAMGACGSGPVAYQNFTTKFREFTQLSGCFVATAAYGSPLAGDVNLLRRVRDRAAAGHQVAAAAAEIYARTSPPVANLLGTSAVARAVARELLAPLVEVAKALDRGGNSSRR